MKKFTAKIFFPNYGLDVNSELVIHTDDLVGLKYLINKYEQQICISYEIFDNDSKKLVLFGG